MEDKDNFWKDKFCKIKQFSFVYVNGDLCSYISFVLITWIIEFGVLKWWCISPLSTFQWHINCLFLDDLVSLICVFPFVLNPNIKAWFQLNQTFNDLVAFICVLNPSTKTMILQPNQAFKHKCIEKHSI